MLAPTEALHEPQKSLEQEFPPLSQEEQDALKVQAFRSVVKDDTSTLTDVLGRLPRDAWAAWQNKAGKDLLTLSQERGSSCAYSVLARALGLLEDMKRESFEERETVWVFLQGEVQPRRATVLEESPAPEGDPEIDDILVEFWEGDGGPERLARCMLCKMPG